MDYVRTHSKNKQPITYDNLTTRVAEIAYTINKRHKFQYEFNFSLLVGAWYQNKASTLNLISAYGWRIVRRNYIGVGSGAICEGVSEKIMG